MKGKEDTERRTLHPEHFYYFTLTQPRRGSSGDTRSDVDRFPPASCPTKISAVLLIAQLRG